MDDFDARRASLDLVTAFVNNNTLSAGELPALLRDVFTAISGFDTKLSSVAHVAEPAQAPASNPVENTASDQERTVLARAGKGSSAHKPAVSVSESLADPGVLVSLITGERFKTLKRHLSKHGLTEAEYKARFNLPDDCPMVAPVYAAVRRKLLEAQKTKGKLAKQAADLEVAPAAGIEPPAATAAKAQTRSQTAKRAQKSDGAPKPVAASGEQSPKQAPVAQASPAAGSGAAAGKPDADVGLINAAPKPAAKPRDLQAEESTSTATPVKLVRMRRMARPAETEVAPETAASDVRSEAQPNGSERALAAPAVTSAQATDSPAGTRSRRAGGTLAKSAVRERKKLSVKFD